MPFAPSRDVFPLDPLPRVRPRPNSLARHAPPGQPKDSKTYIELRGRRFTSGNQVFRKLFQLYANVRCGATGPERDAPTGPGRAAPRCSRRPCPPDTLVPPTPLSPHLHARPSKNFAGVTSPCQGVDMVIIREVGTGMWVCALSRLVQT